MTPAEPYSSRAVSFDEEYDVIVVGYGFAGGAAAIEASDAGARVLMLEKMPDPRFMHECPPYVQDTGYRPLHSFDPVTQTFPYVPAYALIDEEGRRMYPLAEMICNDRAAKYYAWSDDNLKEVGTGLLQKAESIAELAGKMKVDQTVLKATLDRWNAQCASGVHDDFGRLAATMVPIMTPPFYFGEIWPIVSNTQGGPVHDTRQCVLNPFREPIPRLYEAGELGNIWGHLYLRGGNLSECLITGRIAGSEVARLAPWDTSPHDRALEVV